MNNQDSQASRNTEICSSLNRAIMKLLNPSFDTLLLKNTCHV